jgi:hypothetical protein
LGATVTAQPIVTLYWSPSGTYDVYRAVDGCFTYTLQASKVTGSSWKSGTLDKSYKYCYYVINSQNVKSNIVSFTTP